MHSNDRGKGCCLATCNAEETWLQHFAVDNILLSFFAQTFSGSNNSSNSSNGELSFSHYTRSYCTRKYKYNYGILHTTHYVCTSYCHPQCTICTSWTAILTLYASILLLCSLIDYDCTYILLHGWEGSIGEYSPVLADLRSALIYVILFIIIIIMTQH